MSPNSNNSVLHKYTVFVSKTFLFQAIHFVQTVLIQTIQISVSLRTVKNQISSISNSSLEHTKTVPF